MKYLLIDGNNLLHRAFWIAKYKEQEGSNLYLEIFLKSIKLYVDLYPSDKIICTWDKKMHLDDGKNFRQELCEYKQGRNEEYNKKVYEHIDDINRFLLSLGIKIMYPGYLEADDIMHWCSTQHPNDEFVIISVDKDLLQLVSSNTKVYNPIKKQEYNVVNFEALTGVAINNFVLQKAIIGDISDNIKGLEKIGVKRAQKYISGESKFTTEQQELVEKNLKLVDLSQGWQVNEPREKRIYEKQFEMNWPEPMKRVFFALCMKFALYNIMSKPEQFDIFFKEKEKTLKNIFLV
nr:MAG TPA: Exodeoxyribonuclease [Caudoviricetes sp.]